MFSFVKIVVLAGVVMSVDGSTTVLGALDSILETFNAGIEDQQVFHYNTSAFYTVVKWWNPDHTTFNVEGDVSCSNGTLVIGRLQRNGFPLITGTTDSALLKFNITMENLGAEYYCVGQEYNKGPAGSVADRIVGKLSPFIPCAIEVRKTNSSCTSSLSPMPFPKGDWGDIITPLVSHFDDGVSETFHRTVHSLLSGIVSETDLCFLIDSY